MCCAKSLSCVRLFVTPRNVAHQAPQSMEFSRQEYWSRVPFPTPGDLPNPGIKPRSPALQADSLLTEPPEKPKLIDFIKIKNCSTKETCDEKTSHRLGENLCREYI